MNRWTLGVALLLSLVALSATSFEAIDAPASTITVCASGCDYTTIQAAVEMANNGDTIDLAAEIFVGNVFVRQKRLTIRGSGETETIVDGGGSGTVIYLDGANVTLADLTVRNGRGGWSGGGIHIARRDADRHQLRNTRQPRRARRGNPATLVGRAYITSNTITEKPHLRARAEASTAGGG